MCRGKIWRILFSTSVKERINLEHQIKITDSKQNNIVQSTIDVKVFTYVFVAVIEYCKKNPVWNQTHSYCWQMS